MKYIKKELIQATFGLILGLAAQMVWADVINYQGYLTDKSGKPLNNETVNITLTFWDALTGGNAVGAPKSYPNVGVNNGVFSQNVDVSDITFTGPLFLELTVNGEKLAPRQFVTGVPFAYRAKTVEQDQDTLAGLNCAKDQIAKWNGSAWVCAAPDSGPSGSWVDGDGKVTTTVASVGIGTRNPRATLDVARGDLDVPNLIRDNCVWTDYVNEYDRPIDFVCPQGKFLAGVRSEHYNRTEDRRWKFYCCRL